MSEKECKSCKEKGPGSFQIGTIILGIYILFSAGYGTVQIVKEIINLTNIDYVYNKNPKELESLLSDFVGGDVDGALKDWFKSGVRTVNKIDPVQLLNVNEGELDEKLTKKTKVDTYIKDFKDSDAPQFKGKSDDKKVKMAVAAYLSKKNKK